LKNSFFIDAFTEFINSGGGDELFEAEDIGEGTQNMPET
jgi:hypothetical protein